MGGLLHMFNRLTTFQQWMKRTNVDVAIITSSENVFYFSGFYSDPHERLLAIVLFPEDEPFLICPYMETASAKAAGCPYPVYGYKDTEDPLEFAGKESAKRIGRAKIIAVEKNHMNALRYETFQKMFPEARFERAEDPLNKQRLVKDEEELQKLQRAAELADYAIQVGIGQIKEGVSELQIVAAIEYELKKKGVEKMSFSTTVLAGKNAASPHGVPGLTTVKKGDFVLFDLGVVY